MRCQKTTHPMPLDVIHEILVLLPARSALRFKSVSKEWYNLINTPLFAKLQLNKSLKPDSRHNHILVCDTALGISIVDDIYDPLKLIKLNWPKDARHDDNIRIVGSCNGLVCLEVSRWNDDGSQYGFTGVTYFTVRYFLICNPTTRTYKSILPCTETKWTKASFLSYDFGYDIQHDDYKIVVTSSKFWTENDRQVCIYSLKNDLWSSSEPPTHGSTGRCWEIDGEGIFINNMLHYLVFLEIEGFTYHLIARFDIVSEKWRDDLSLPVPVQVNNYVRFGKLDGWLYLHVGEFGVNSSDVWVMEQHGSWQKMFHLPQLIYRHDPIALSKDGCHRLLVHDNLDNINFWYDQRDYTRELFKLEKMPRGRRSFKLCIPSLVAIPGCSATKLQQIEDGD